MDDDLLTRAKETAARTGRTLTRVLEDALREALARGSGAPSPERRASLPTFNGRGLLPGVDLDHTAALVELMDQNAAP
jgi:hypothetical protein